MNAAFAIVDLFASLGGLAEGFSAYETGEGMRPFSVRLSVEKEKSAHQTLLFRAFRRQFGARFPQEYYDWLTMAVQNRTGRHCILPNGKRPEKRRFA